MEKKLKQRFVIIIFGPTGVGKSGFAERLAHKIPSQLVNCDIGQFYAPFGIGTAKPDWRASGMRQHLFDIINEPKDYSVHEYRKLVLQTIETIWQEEEIPILVGGSGFYLRSLFFPPVSSDQCVKHVCPQILEKKFATLANQQLWNMLHEVDSQRANQIEKNDRYRVCRALEIWEKTGKKPSEYAPAFNFPSNFLFVFLHRDRSILYERIDSRTYQMIQEGWINEVEQLMETEWEQFFMEKKLIGYDTIVEYLKGDRSPESLDKAIGIIQQKTRNYAKRQVTFWRSLQKQLQEAIAAQSGIDQTGVASKAERIDIDVLKLEVYLESLVSYLNNIFE